MALWLVRAGSHGEHEAKFLDEKRVYVTWDELNYDLAKLKSQAELRTLLHDVYPASGDKKIINHASQIWPFVADMKEGDWVILPSKFKRGIHVAEITGPYRYNPGGPDPYFHWRPVNWIATDVPRSNFSQDLLDSFGAFMSICEVKRNDAEKRVRAMAAKGWRGSAPALAPTGTPAADAADGGIDIEQAARDSIAKLIIAKFKGHGLTRLVDALLKAQGYTTYVSPPGPDKGIDILAGSGPLGFGEMRLCVQVKSTADPVDTPTLHQLVGSMQNVGAAQGLLVSWGGFKQSVYREEASQFFRVRLWDQQVLIEELLNHYDKLDEDVRAEIPLKRIWTIAVEEEE